MSKILGLNAFHADAAACLIIDGELISAAEEERFLRIKHWAGFPSESIKFCLSNSGLSLSDIDYVAINSDPTKNFSKKISYGLSSSGIEFLFKRFRNPKKDHNTQKHLKKIKEHFRAEIVKIEHHQCHLASAHIPSKFEESVSLSIDGLGDFVSTAWGIGKKKFS